MVNPQTSPFPGFLMISREWSKNLTALSQTLNQQGVANGLDWSIPRDAVTGDAIAGLIPDLKDGVMIWGDMVLEVGGINAKAAQPNTTTSAWWGNDGWVYNPTAPDDRHGWLGTIRTDINSILYTAQPLSYGSFYIGLKAHINLGKFPVDEEVKLIEKVFDHKYAYKGIVVEYATSRVIAAADAGGGLVIKSGGNTLLTTTDATPVNQVNQSNTPAFIFPDPATGDLAFDLSCTLADAGAGGIAEVIVLARLF